MNKILIPLLLGVTIVIAGVFAFSPVEEATTLHVPSITSANLASGAIEVPMMWATANIVDDRFFGPQNDSLTETVVEAVVPADGTISSLFVEIAFAPGAGDTGCKPRTDQALLESIPATDAASLSFQPGRVPASRAGSLKVIE